MNYRERGERVPLSLVMPYVQRWLDDWYGGQEHMNLADSYVTKQMVKDDHPEWSSSVNETLGVLLLASRTTLNPTTIGQYLRRWRAGVDMNIGFFDADELFTAMDQTGLWRRDPQLCAIRAIAEEAATLSHDSDEDEGTP